jgi:hypothetical protein
MASASPVNNVEGDDNILPPDPHPPRYFRRVYLNVILLTLGVYGRKPSSFLFEEEDQVEYQEARDLR